MAYLYILGAILLRMVPHPWNATPIGSMFLFGGATLRRKVLSLAVPLAALLASDYAVDRILYHGHYAWFSPFTWTGFLLVGLIGWSLRDKITVGRVAGASVAGSVVFYLVSNFGVWMASGSVHPVMYSATLGGLIDCYIAGLPFFGNTLLGDLAYAALMFGSYRWLQNRRLAVAEAAK